MTAQNTKYKTIDLFAGIGGIRLGFKTYGCQNVFFSEWDSSAKSMYQENFGEKPFGDINDIEPKDIPSHDILLAGFPCQPFSIAGKGLGFERLMLFVTGMQNIRDVIPFPRTPKNASF